MQPRYWYGLDRWVNPAGFGCWQLAGRYAVDGRPHGWTDIDPGEAVSLVHYALDKGIRFFDTAAGYGRGRSEDILGEALSSSPDAIVCTKVALSPEEEAEGRAGEALAAAVEGSLRRLRRDRIDILLLHGPPDSLDWSTFDRTVLEDFIAAGKMLAFGVSSRSLAGAERVVDARFGSCLEWAFNLLERRPASSLFQRLAASRMNFIARSPLSRGIVTSRARAGGDAPNFPSRDFRSTLPDDWIEWTSAAAGRLLPLAAAGGGLEETALRYCLSFEPVSAVIPGMHNRSHVDSLLAAAAAGRLEEPVLAQIERLVPPCYPSWA